MALTLENTQVTLNLPQALLEVLLPSRHNPLLSRCQIYEVTCSSSGNAGYFLHILPTPAKLEAQLNPRIVLQPEVSMPFPMFLWYHHLCSLLCSQRLSAIKTVKQILNF